MPEFISLQVPSKSLLSTMPTTCLFLQIAEESHSSCLEQHNNVVVVVVIISLCGIYEANYYPHFCQLTDIMLHSWCYRSWLQVISFLVTAPGNHFFVHKVGQDGTIPPIYAAHLPQTSLQYGTLQN